MLAIWPVLFNLRNRAPGTWVGEVRPFSFPHILLQIENSIPLINGVVSIGVCQEIPIVRFGHPFNRISKIWIGALTINILPILNLWEISYVFC